MDNREKQKNPEGEGAPRPSDEEIILLEDLAPLGDVKGGAGTIFGSEMPKRPESK